MYSCLLQLLLVLPPSTAASCTPAFYSCSLHSCLLQLLLVLLPSTASPFTPAFYSHLLQLLLKPATRLEALCSIYSWLAGMECALQAARLDSPAPTPPRRGHVSPCHCGVHAPKSRPGSSFSVAPCPRASWRALKKYTGCPTPPKPVWTTGPPTYCIRRAAQLNAWDICGGARAGAF